VAGRKLKASGMLEGSTILEVLISMIVIIVVFGIGMMIFGNVTRASLSEKKMEAESVLQQRMLDIEASNDSLSTTIQGNDLRVEQKISQYGDNAHLSLVQLAAYDNNQQKVAELDKVIIKP